MRTTFLAAASYTLLGLISGLFYRELTRPRDFTGFTQLSVVHTHLLTLGTLVMLLLLVLQRSLQLNPGRLYWWGFGVYNFGLILTAGALWVGGTQTVLGTEPGAAHAGIAGLGHIGLTVGLLLLFIWIGKGVWALTAPAHARTEVAS
ncbi:DUF2871 family protein [Actinomyces sp. F1_1611]